METLSEATEELNLCIMWLYLSGALFLVLALYLNEVVPKEYGVSKSPLFFLKRKQRVEFDHYTDS